MKKNKCNDDDNLYTQNRNRNKSDVKGVLPNIMKLRQICNFAEFTDFGINGNGLTEFSNRECALQFLEHSAKLKVRYSKNILLHCILDFFSHSKSILLSNIKIVHYGESHYLLIHFFHFFIFY